MFNSREEFDLDQCCSKCDQQTVTESDKKPVSECKSTHYIMKIKAKLAVLNNVLSCFTCSCLYCHNPGTVTLGALLSSIVLESRSALALDTCLTAPLQLSSKLSQLLPLRPFLLWLFDPLYGLTYKYQFLETLSLGCINSCFLCSFWINFLYL